MLSRPDFQISDSAERIGYFHVFRNGIFSCIMNAKDADAVKKKFQEEHPLTEFDKLDVRPVAPA